MPSTAASSSSVGRAVQTDAMGGVVFVFFFFSNSFKHFPLLDFFVYFTGSFDAEIFLMCDSDVARIPLILFFDGKIVQDAQESHAKK